MIKILLWVVGVVVLLVAAVFGLQILASERVEVIELHTMDAGGKEVTTHLWVVDHEGTQYLRSGTGAAGWLDRAKAEDGAIEMTRNGKRMGYQIRPRPEYQRQINDLMSEKYTWGDDVITVLIGGRDDALPIALEPLE